jgi:L-threonylcarbamoyladenylate synthase
VRVTIHEADRCLKQSQPVAIPTETVWGLAARWDDESGIKKIFQLKGRPLKNPLIIHIATLDPLFHSITQAPSDLFDLIDAFWPGGLTFVLPVHEGAVLPIVRANLPTAAFRMPNHAQTQALIAQTGPLVAPSANKSGLPSATTPEHIEQDFGADLPILEAQTFCDHGLESTILIWQGAWYLGRPGAIDTDAIASVIGYTPTPHKPGEQPLCPGQLFRHYAPKARLTLSTSDWDASVAHLYDGVLGFSDRIYPNAAKVLSMGPSTDPKTVGALLYAALRDLDRFALQSVYVDIQVPNSSAWLAILDRLKKAALGK